MRFPEQQPMKLLENIVKNKDDKSGWAVWRDVCQGSKFATIEEVIGCLNKSNLIVQRFGPANQVKLANTLLENIIMK